MDDVWGRSDLLLKVKEPIAPEYPRLREGLTLFTYLHIAADEPLTSALVDSGITAVAYETVETSRGALPLLAPMSEIAGRLAPQAGADHLEKPKGGRGILLGGVAGVAPARVLVIGGGMVGYNAAVIALGMGAHVTILERSVDRMRYLEQILTGRVQLLMSSSLQVEEAIKDADLVIGAVLIPGALAPKLVTRDMLGTMKDSSVLVDVAIDQGGCAETSKPTTHDDPVYTVDGVIHYCVANMPGAVPITSTRALTNVTLPYVEEIAEHGVLGAIRLDPELARRRQRHGREDHVRGGRRGARARLHAARRRARRRRRGLDGSAFRPTEEAARAGSVVGRGLRLVRLLRRPLGREDPDDGVRDQGRETDDGRDVHGEEK